MVVDIALGQSAHIDHKKHAVFILLVKADIAQNVAERHVTPFFFEKLARKHEYDAFRTAQDFLVLTTQLVHGGVIQGKLVYFEVVLELRQTRHELFVEPVLVVFAVAYGGVVAFRVFFRCVFGSAAWAEEKIACAVSEDLSASTAAAAKRQQDGQHEGNYEK